MHLHFERNANSKCDCNILSLSWIGKVPEGDIPDDDGEGWKLNRTSYYNEGWLATGNVRGIVGVTYTSSLYECWGYELPQRTNYNLRGHRSEVIIVKWNEPYQKLASCDASGVIFVWIKYEGRWSIELINDRNTRVTHFSWSHDGRLAVICYQDGFVLVGTVQGQRISTAFLNLIDSQSHQFPVTALTWGHNDRRIFVATGPEVHIAWVSTRISSLQLICSLQIYKEIAAGSKQSVAQLPLPNRIRQIISKLFMHTIRCPVPIGSNVRDFVSRATRHRLHCTMLRHDDNEYYITPAVYTLYLEYFGGLVPLLKGKRISKIKPDFVIYDPQVSDKVIHQLEASASGLSTSNSSSKPHPDPRDDSDVDEGCASPRLRRKRTPKPSDQALNNMNYVDTLPEVSYRYNKMTIL
ncbi:hypothetical protein WDU94_011740 [Cyamophila willieti]